MNKDNLASSIFILSYLLRYFILSCYLINREILNIRDELLDLGYVHLFEKKYTKKKKKFKNMIPEKQIEIFKSNWLRR